MSSRRSAGALSLVTCMLVDTLCFLALLGMLVDVQATKIQQAQSFFLYVIAVSVNHLVHTSEP